MSVSFLKKRNKVENLNKYIRKQNNLLTSSPYTMEGLFNIIHDQDDRIFCEYLQNFQIERIKYRDFRPYCFKMATFLTSKVKEEKGKFIGIYLENSMTFLAVFWGLLISGYKVCLLNVRLPLSVNLDIINTLGIKTIITQKHINDDIEEILIDNKNGYLSEVNSCSEMDNIHFENEIALSTTATTKNYKICIYNGRDLTYQIMNAKKIIKSNSMLKRHYNHELKLLTFLPFYHIFGLIATYFWFSIFGRTFVFLNDYSSDTIIKTIRRHKVTHVFAVPLLWNTIVREIKKELNKLSEKERRKAEKGFKLSLFIQNLFPELGTKWARNLLKRITNATFGDSIKFLISGGGYISDETLYIINAIGYPLFNGYGSTEIGITSVELRRKPKWRIMGSVGKPFASVDYKISDNELLVKGLSTCSKIIYKDKRVEVVNKDEYYNTHDLSFSDRRGYYYIEGRGDDVFVSSGGEKISPDVIEKKCLLTSINNYSILVVDNELSLVIEIKKTFNTLKIKQIYDEVTNTLSTLKRDGFNITKAYYTFDKILSDNAIKVSRKILLDDIKSGKVSLHNFSELLSYSSKEGHDLTGGVYQTIREIFSSILGIDSNSISDTSHFILDLGGTSLDYCTLLIKLENEFEMSFKFQESSFSTVKEFGDYILDKINNKE